MTLTRLLTTADVEGYVALRREALLDSPWSFLGSPGDDSGSDPSIVRERIGEPENRIAGVFDEEGLRAVAGVVRSDRVKTRHRAMIWGVYCTPAARGRGYARSAMLLAIETARSWDGVEVVFLSASVNAPEAIGLYESMGFVRWGVEPDVVRVGGTAYDEVHLQLRL